MMTETMSARKWLAVLALGALAFEALGGRTTAAMAPAVSHPEANEMLAWASRRRQRASRPAWSSWRQRAKSSLPSSPERAASSPSRERTAPAVALEELSSRSRPGGVAEAQRVASARHMRSRISVRSGRDVAKLSRA